MGIWKDFFWYIINFKWWICDNVEKNKVIDIKLKILFCVYKIVFNLWYLLKNMFKEEDKSFVINVIENIWYFICSWYNNVMIFYDLEWFFFNLKILIKYLLLRMYYILIDIYYFNFLMG